MSQYMTVLSLPPEIKVDAVGCESHVHTPLEWPRSIAVSLKVVKSYVERVVSKQEAMRLLGDERGSVMSEIPSKWVWIVWEASICLELLSREERTSVFIMLYII